ncbi:MAG TPA: stage III sporulation protein AE [Thermaerobacter sp.]
MGLLAVCLLSLLGILVPPRPAAASTAGAVSPSPGVGWAEEEAGPAGEEGGSAEPSSPSAVTAATVDEIARKQWEELDAEGFLQALDRVREQVAGRLPGLDWESTLHSLRQGSLPWSATDVLAALFRAFADEVVTSGGLLLRLLVLAVLLAVLQSIENAFGNEAVARAAYAVVFLVLISLALVSFRDALALARNTIQNLVDFLLASLPVLLPLMAATGAVATAGLFHPLVIAVAQSVSVVVSQWVLPLIFLAAVTELVGHFPLGMSLSGLARLLRQAAVVVLGLAMTVFLAVVAIQGAAGTVADGIALRTAKYLVGAFVPVVGGMLADSVELVVTSSMLLRNAVNLLGLLAVFALVALPLVKLAVLVFVYRLVAAAIQPVGPGHVTASLQAMGDHIVLVAVATAVVGLMFFIVLSVMLAAGNAAVMMR